MLPQIFVLAIIFLPLLFNCIDGLKNGNNLKQFNATEKIEAELYTSGSNFKIYDDCTQGPSVTYLGELSTSTVLEYDQVDFGGGVQSVSFRVTNVDSSEALDISLHLSSSTNTPILTVPITSTGSDKCAFVTVFVLLETFPTGLQNLFITFPSGEGGQLFLDWFQFSESSSKIIPATETIQAENYDFKEQISISDDCSAVFISPSATPSLAEYYRVDFGEGVQSVAIRVFATSSTYTQSISFKTGSTSSPTFATININYTGSCNFIEVSAAVNVSPTGVQDLFLIFDQAYYAFLDSFVFDPQNWNATDKIEAEDYTSASNVSVYEDCSDPNISYVGALQTNSVLEYYGLKFGSGVEMVTLRVYSLYTESPLDVAMHLGNYTSTPFVTIPVGQTGTERCDFYTMTAFLDPRPTGVQNLFITFPSAQGGYLHIDWFLFNQTVNSN